MSLSEHKWHKNSLYYSSFRGGVEDFLNTLHNDIVFSIAKTASSQKVIPENKQEAIEVILFYTTDIDRFFSYRCISRDTLTYYLNVNNQEIAKLATLNHLVTSVKNFWATKKSEYETNKMPVKMPNISSDQHTSQLREENIKSLIHKVRSDIFAKNFVDWFYKMLNNLTTNSSSEKLQSSMFCLNCSLEMYHITQTYQNEFSGSGADDCRRLLKDFLDSQKFLFAPNLETGIQALQSSHGLVKILCCGTLHIDNKFVGIFEQEFGLVKSPVDQNWKIFYSKANYKEGNYEIPNLQLSPVFEIEN